MKIIDKMYEFIVSIQFVLFFIYILENFNNLSNIQQTITLTDTISFTVTINLYAILTTVIILSVILIGLSFSVVGTGMNEEGTKITAKLFGFITIYLILYLGIANFLQYMQYASLINLVITLPHLLKVMNLFMGENS